MDPEVTVVSVLKAAGLVVYPDKVPTGGTYPCVVYQRISTPVIRSHQGVEIEYPRIQVACHARTRKTANDTATVAKQVLDINVVDFQVSYKESELDMVDVEANIHSRILDFIVWPSGA